MTNFGGVMGEILQKHTAGDTVFYLVRTNRTVQDSKVAFVEYWEEKDGKQARQGMVLESTYREQYSRGQS